MSENEMTADEREAAGRKLLEILDHMPRKDVMSCCLLFAAEAARDMELSEAMVAGLVLEFLNSTYATIVARKKINPPTSRTSH